MTGPINWISEMLRQELGEMYGAQVWMDQQRILRLYEIYEGRGQVWQLPTGLDYEPTQLITNHTKKLIKRLAGFMFGRTPEITIVPDAVGFPSGKANPAGRLDGLSPSGSVRLGDDDANQQLCGELEQFVRATLEDNGWRERLIKAGRDCFVGKRVALKLSGEPGQPIRIRFFPATEFCHDLEGDGQDALTKAIFYYHQNLDPEPGRQRIWVQRYWREQDAPMVSEAVYDGEGRLVEQRTQEQRIGLSQLPVWVIVNDGLTGDPLGESDVAEIAGSQDRYNRMKSDDQDALRFSMFPAWLFTDADESTMKSVKIAPGAMIDMTTDSAMLDGQARAEIMESKFSYDARFEHSLDRLQEDMYSLLSVPRANIEDIKSLGVSGKAMKAMYWDLICKCEERWATWDTALCWMVRMIAEMGTAYLGKGFDAARYTVKIEHLYPLTDDEEEERKLDLQEVAAQARSRESYIAKWQPDQGEQEELERMAHERQLLEESYQAAWPQGG